VQRASLAGMLLFCLFSAGCCVVRICNDSTVPPNISLALVSEGEMLGESQTMVAPFGCRDDIFVFVLFATTVRVEADAGDFSGPPLDAVEVECGPSDLVAVAWNGSELLAFVNGEPVDE